MKTDNKQDAIAKLQSLVDRIPSVQGQRRFSEDFKKWKNDARIALKWIFQNDPEAVNHFDGIGYSLRA